MWVSAAAELVGQWRTSRLTPRGAPGAGFSTRRSASTARTRRGPGQAATSAAAPGSSTASATNTRRRTSRPWHPSLPSEHGRSPPPTVKARAANQSRAAPCGARPLASSAIRCSAPRAMIAPAAFAWQEAASRLTSAPRTSSPASSASSIAGSPPPSATRRCASARPLLVANALTRCSGVLPRRRSKERRTVLPSTAIRGGAPSSSRPSSPATNARRVQARKPRSNASGSIGISTRWAVSCEGMPCGGSRKRESRARFERPMTRDALGALGAGQHRAHRDRQPVVQPVLDPGDRTRVPHAPQALRQPAQHDVLRADAPGDR